MPEQNDIEHSENDDYGNGNAAEGSERSDPRVLFFAHPASFKEQSRAQDALLDSP